MVTREWLAIGRGGDIIWGSAFNIFYSDKKYSIQIYGEHRAGTGRSNTHTNINSTSIIFIRNLTSLSNAWLEYNSNLNTNHAHDIKLKENKLSRGDWRVLLVVLLVHPTTQTNLCPTGQKGYKSIYPIASTTSAAFLYWFTFLDFKPHNWPKSYQIDPITSSNKTTNVLLRCKTNGKIVIDRHFFIHYKILWNDC